MKRKDQNKIIRSYAEALYEAAVAENAVDEVVAQTRDFCNEATAKDKIIAALANPLWSNKDKQQALAEIAMDRNFGAPLTGLLKTMAENGRSAALFDVLKEFEKVYYARSGITPVKVATVMDLSKEQQQRLEKVMQNYVGGKVVINYEICPDILGGLCVEVGGKLIDDTIKGKLKRLELLMKGTM